MALPANADLKFIHRHNSSILIDPLEPDSVYYHSMLTYLLRSRVHYVLTFNDPVVLSYLRDFWTTARADTTVNPHVIRGTVAGRELVFSAEDLRVFLELGTSEQDAGPQEFPTALRHGAFGRMGYGGDLNRSPYVKTFLQGNWRFLMHVLIQCLAARKSAYDGMNVRLQSLMISLVYNKPYSISGYLFDECVANTTMGAKDKFLLYPRFIMRLINGLLPELPMVGETVRVAVISKRIYTDCRNVRGTRVAPYTPLFGAIMNENYVAPPHNGWEDVPAAGHGPVNQGQVPLPPQVNIPPPVPPFVADLQQQQAVLEDVFQQLEQPVVPGQVPVNVSVAEAVVNQVLLGEDPIQDDYEAIDDYLVDPNEVVQDSAELNVQIDETARYLSTRISQDNRGKRPIDPDYEPSDEEDSTIPVLRRQTKVARTDAGPSSVPLVPSSTAPVVSTAQLDFLSSASLTLPSTTPMVGVTSSQILLPLSTTIITPTTAPLVVTTAPLSPRQASPAVTESCGDIPASPIPPASPTPTEEFDPEEYDRLDSPVPSVIPTVDTSAGLTAQVAVLTQQVHSLEATVKANNVAFTTQVNLLEATIRANNTELAGMRELMKLLIAQGEKTACSVEKLAKQRRDDVDDADDDQASQEQPRTTNALVLYTAAGTSREKGTTTQQEAGTSSGVGKQTVGIGKQLRLSDLDNMQDDFEGNFGDLGFNIAEFPRPTLDDLIFTSSELNLLADVATELDKTGNQGEVDKEHVAAETVIAAETVNLEDLGSMLLHDVSTGHLDQDFTESEFHATSKDKAKRVYFRKLAEATKYKKQIDLTNAKTLTKGIMS